jgi:hypothetical protein
VVRGTPVPQPIVAVRRMRSARARRGGALVRKEGVTIQ